MPGPGRFPLGTPATRRVAGLLLAGLTATGCSMGASAHPESRVTPAGATASGASPSADSATLSAPLAPVPTSAAPAAPAPTPPAVGRLRGRITPDVFVALPATATPQQLVALRAATGATHLLTIAVGHVELGHGSTLAVGVNPSTFRGWTPKGTAESTPLWQTIAGGSVAVAHTVAHALDVTLGGTATVQPEAAPAVSAAASTGAAPATLAPATATPAATAQPLRPVGDALAVRVGALATTALPGVGLTVDDSYDATLHLVPGAGIILAAAGRDPVVTAALAEQVLGPGAHAAPLRVPVTDTGRLTWVAPAAGPITAGFGNRQSPLVPGKTEFHGGIDIGAPLGAPIYAASSGTVSYAGPAQGFGNEVILTHAGNVSTVYGHMEKILVTAGSPVTVGQPIALVGSEGESTGPHLHFEVHVNGAYTDPLAWLQAHGVAVAR